MNLRGRRQSSNVEDQRGNGGKIAAGGGIVGIIIAGLMLLLNGGDPTELLQQTMNSQASQTSKYTSSPEEDSLFVFASQILASTEDVWTAEFKKMGRTYRAPKLKIFHGSVQSGCGGATSETGPFYCSADECVYLDLEFFMSMKKTLGADGDFAYAYVIAHEVGHHVQHLLGTLDEAHKAMRSASKTESNQISVRLELQPTSTPACGVTTRMRCSARWSPATSKRPRAPPEKSATTTCRRKAAATRCPTASPTAPPPSAPNGSRKASRRAI